MRFMLTLALLVLNAGFLIANMADHNPDNNWVNYVSGAAVVVCATSLGLQARE